MPLEPWPGALVPWYPVALVAAASSAQAQGLEVCLAVRPGGAEDT